ncbi:MAG: hypothetical protein U1E73_14080 [Planctomycetota bacterium]
MRTVIASVLSLLAASATAQNWYVPDSNAAAGTCNVIPFGSSSVTTWGSQKYQSKATAADLGAIVGVVTGLGFAPCGTGNIHFDALEVVIDHHPAGAPLDPTFANNLTPNAVTVLSVTNFDWNITADAWNEMGLQQIFVYNGVDDVVIQITTTNAVTTGTTGFHRDVRQRLYWFGTAGPAPATGTIGTAAQKIELSMLMGKLSTYGRGCAGTNGIPTVSLSGVPNPGTIVNTDMTGGLPNGFAFQIYGLSNGFPFPLDLGNFGMPGCLQYTDNIASLLVFLDGSGAAAKLFGIPNNGGLIGVKVFTQFACVDPTANATGLTTSNYGRILIGN